jgi:uncharacterized membrane protein
MIQRTIHALLCLLAAAFVALSAAAQVAAQTNPNFEYGVNRPGGDYRSFDLPFDAPGLCAGQCAQEGQCRAWTYVAPGLQGPKARCWLKNVVPAPTRPTYVVSGLRGTAAQPPAPPPVTPPMAGGSLTGRWASVAAYAGGTYDFVQSGSAFKWTLLGKPEVGQGTVSGNTLQATWSGGNSGVGKIAQRSAAGDPVRIEWANGVVMTRNPPR